MVLPLNRQPARQTGPRGRQQAGLRLALLSLAAVILLVGAVIAGVFCYESVRHGPPMATQPAPGPMRAPASIPAPPGE
jgi:hypothetical protein